MTTPADELRTAAQTLRMASNALPPFHLEAATLSVRSNTSGREIRVADPIFRALQIAARTLGPAADWLDVAAERHPKRVGTEVILGQAVHHHEYCGACQDWPVQTPQWPCPQVEQALAVARAINGGEQP